MSARAHIGVDDDARMMAGDQAVGVAVDVEQRRDGCPPPQAFRKKADVAAMLASAEA